MTTNAFDDTDLRSVVGPSEAFDLGSAATPRLQALQHHLVLEVVAHLQDAAVPFVFRGGTALHTKLARRTRFSIDADLTTSDPAAVANALKSFVDRFPRSETTLEEPPENLKVDGVRHTLRFGRVETSDGKGVRVMVEVVKAEGSSTEPLRLVVDGMDWARTVNAPTLDAFVGQKLAVLGPNTIGKRIGLAGDGSSRPRQTVCKQIFDLRQLLHESLDFSNVTNAYVAAVAEGNALRGKRYTIQECLADASALLAALKGPRSGNKAEPLRYDLWAGFMQSKPWFPAKGRWDDTDYRIAAGVLARLVECLQRGEGPTSMEQLRAPLLADIPQQTRDKLANALRVQEEWCSVEDFDLELRLAWAWAPRHYW